MNNSADKNAILDAEGTRFSAHDSTLVAGVEGSQYATGYFGYAAVAHSDMAVNVGTYPRARPLFIYSDAKIMADRPQVDAEITDVGYSPAPISALGDAAGTWLGTLKLLPDLGM